MAGSKWGLSSEAFSGTAATEYDLDVNDYVVWINDSNIFWGSCLLWFVIMKQIVTSGETSEATCQDSAIMRDDLVTTQYYISLYSMGHKKSTLWYSN